MADMNVSAADAETVTLSGDVTVTLA